jgi:hypothetical protein
MTRGEMTARVAIAHGLDRLHTKVLAQVAEHWGVDTSGMSPKDLHEALVAHPRYEETKRAVEAEAAEAARIRAMDPKDRPIEPGSFTEKHPYPAFCGSRENHERHDENRVLARPDGSRYYHYQSCPGWETTHTVTVTEAGGRVVGEEKVDLRGRLDYSGSTNDPVLTLLYEADAAKKPRPSDDELTFGVAASYVAPEVCPWDSDRCHEHLYEYANKLEEEGEEE